MVKQNAIKVFEEKKVRTLWDSETEEWYFSVVDVVAVLTESENPRRYWSDLKRKLAKEGSQLYAEIVQLKMLSSDGKYYKTDVATTQQLFRLIQSIPSLKAEPFKLWMAQVAKERLDQMQDPELSIQQAMTDYKRLGYSDSWINQRLKSIEIRKELTDEWKRRGLQEGVQFATLTDIIYQSWADKTAKEYKQFKGLKKENLRDNMTNKELVLNMLADFPISPVMVVLKDLIDSYLDLSQIDKKRVYIIGISMGAMGVYDLTVRYPDIFAAAIPICGTVNPKRLEAAKEVKFRLFHGDADNIVPTSGSRRAYKALKKAGAEVQYIEFPGVGHTSWHQAFELPDFMKWLFSKEKP